MHAQPAGRATIAALLVLLAAACSEEFSSGAPDAGAGGSAGAGARAGDGGGGTGGSAGSRGGSAGAGAGGGASGAGASAQDAGTGGASDDYADAVLGSAPAAYWRLSDAEDSTVAKDSAGSFDGAYTNSVVHPVTGLLAKSADGAAQFADSSSSRVDVGDVFDFAAGVAFSLELWVKPTATEEDFLVQKSTLTDDYGYMLRTSPTGVTFQLKTPDDLLGVPVAQLSLSSPTHLVAVFDGNQACVYVNGQSKPCVAKAIQLQDTGAPFRIGQHFSGVIDEVAVYDRALSPAEIAAHYAIGSAK